jgi:membrane protein YqaA with SNARE-associated domain
MTELTLTLFGIKGFLANVLEWLKALGAPGLFGISLIDSVGVPLPGGPDAAMIWATTISPLRMPVYALVATAGSAIGCTGLYLLARRAGSAALSRVAPSKRDRIENLLGRYDLMAIMIPAVLPPPFPFKPFVLCAGVFKFKIWRFIAAIFVGRAVRFLLEGWLAVNFGEEAGVIIKQNGWKMLVGVAVIAVIAVFIKLSLGRRSHQVAPGHAGETRGSSTDSTRI